MQPVAAAASLPPAAQSAAAAAQPPVAPAQTTYIDCIKRMAPFWAQVEPRLAAAFDGHPTMINQVIPKEFILAHVNAPSIITETGKVDLHKYRKYNADTVALAAQVLCQMVPLVCVDVAEIDVRRIEESVWKSIGEDPNRASIAEKVKRLKFHHFDVEADKVPSMFPLVWREAPHVRESDQKLVYTVNCCHRGLEVSKMIMELESGPYFQEGMAKYHIDPSKEPAVRADFEKIKMIVRNIVTNVPQCSLYFQDMVESYRNFHSSDVFESSGRIPAEDAIFAITGFIFFEENEARPGSCLATECLRVKDLIPSDSIASMRENLELAARRHRGIVAGFREELEKRHVPGFSHIL